MTADAHAHRGGVLRLAGVFEHPAEIFQRKLGVHRQPARLAVVAAGLTVTLYALSLGKVSRPSLTALLSASCSFSEIAKGTQIGLDWEIVVSNVSLAVTRLPSDFGARLDRPLIGATTRV